MTDNTTQNDITVLYVEDEAATREQVGRLLTTHGFRLLAAENGVQGLELYRSHAPDIIITDIMMPRMNGLEMARSIREHSTEAQIVVITAFSDTNYLLEAIDIGIDKFVVKPIEFAKLLAAIEQCVTTIRIQQRVLEQAARIHMLSNALEQSPSMAMITDTRGIIEYVNHKFCEVTGYTAEEAVGQTPRILKSGETPATVYRDIWRAILDGREWHGVLQNRGKNGTVFWEYSNISPLTSPDGTIIKYIKTGEDITERRKLEAEALKTKKLEATTILAGGMAHDFNNLLQVILGYVNLAKRRAEPGSLVYGFLDEAEKSSEHARELSQRLLTFARGGESLRHTMSLDRLVTTVVAAALSGAPVTSEFDLPDGIPLVSIDETQISQVFSNLAVNSLEAMPDGGTIRVALRKCTISAQDSLPLAPGEYVHVSFLDTGRGIQPENLGKIFDPYFTTKQMGSQKGMGLGLAVCQAIIRKHNGTITVESRPMQGTTFHIYLPAADKGENARTV
jgi:two-component system cell cycle sensor histidine kinase/response regulator CckA